MSNCPPPKQSNLDLLLPKALKVAWDETVKPTLAAAGLGLGQILTGIRHALAPRAGVPAETLAAVMHLTGERAHAAFVLQESMSAVRHMFEKMPRADVVDFWDRMKTGQPQKTDDLQAIAQFYREQDDRMYTEVSQYKNIGYKENHHRILWRVVPGRPTGFRGGFRPGKRPLQGTKGFLKRATLEDVSEGLEKGGIPYSWNPQVMFEHTQADYMRFLTAQRIWEWAKGNKQVRFVQRFGEIPSGYAPIHDPIAKVYFPVPQGVVYAGDWYAEQNLARLLNKSLSRDYLRDQGTALGAIGRGLLWFKNLTTAIELSFSPFHAVFETFEAMSSQFALGSLKLWNEGVRKGDASAAVEGLVDILKVPIAPVTAARLGGNAIAAVRAMNQNVIVAPTARQARQFARGIRFAQQNPAAMDALGPLFDGGLRLEMSSDYRLNSIRAFREAIHGGAGARNYLGAMIHALPALNEMFMRPLFQMYIPRLKAGFALKEYAQQMRQEGPTADPFKIARAVVDRIDNRFGEMNFDNLFWNNTMKTALQITFRSVTWKMGNVRGFGGAAKGQARELAEPLKLIHDRIRGRQGSSTKDYIPKLDPGFAWFLGLVVTTTAIGSLIAKILSGKYPWEWAELAMQENPQTGITGAIALETLHPRVGGLDDRGKPNRVSAPTYLKDAEHLKRHPLNYVVSSMSGPATRIPEAWQNRDFFGDYIYDPTAPAYQKTLDFFAHSIGVPFMLSTMRQSQAMGASKTQIAMGFAGFPRASRELDLTNAEKLAIEYLKVRGSVPRLPEAVAKSSKARQFTRELRDGTPGAEQRLADAVQAGEITAIQSKNIVRNSETDYLSRLVKRLGIEQALQVYEAASPKERERIKQILYNKQKLIQKLPPQKREAVEERFNKLVSYLPDLPSIPWSSPMQPMKPIGG